jgi:hypothetical protein
MRTLGRIGAVVLSFVSGGVQPIPQSLVEYGGVNQSRQGVFNDSTLNTTNVAASFGRVGTLAVDGGQVYAQPLFVQGVKIGTGTFDLMIVVTMMNSVYAFDANALTQLWHVNFGSPYTAYPRNNVMQNNFYEGQPVGCLSTPTVDRGKGVVFVVCAGATGALSLLELSLANGNTVASVSLSGQFPGTGDSGDTVIDGELQFLPGQHEQRAGLVLANGNIYIALSSYNDQHPWHGWVLAYSEATLMQTAVWCDTPNGYGGGIWLTGNAPAVDAAGNLYLSTGNGDYDGTANFGNSVLKLSPSLTLLDWFTPSNWMTLESMDIDVSSGRIMLPGDGYLFAADRDYRQYVLNTACMGHLQGSESCVPQLVTVPGSAFGLYGGLFFNNTVYVTTDNGPVYSYAYQGSGVLGTMPAAQTSASFAHPGARLAGSAGGNTAISNAVLWATTCASSSIYTAQPGVLRAFNPVTLAEVYNSTENAGDTLGTFAKFSVPMVVEGKVWVTTGDGTVAVYGLK